jgi:hypothetical protein
LSALLRGNRKGLVGLLALLRFGRPPMRSVTKPANGEGTGTSLLPSARASAGCASTRVTSCTSSPSEAAGAHNDSARGTRDPRVRCR